MAPPVASWAIRAFRARCFCRRQASAARIRKVRSASTSAAASLATPPSATAPATGRAPPTAAEPFALRAYKTRTPRPFGPGVRGRRRSVSRVLSRAWVTPMRGGDHSSRATVTRRLEQPTRRLERAALLAPAYVALLPMGFAVPSALPRRAVGSYPAVSPLPSSRRLRERAVSDGGLFSVALSSAFPPPGVTRHRALWSSDFPPAAPVQACPHRKRPATARAASTGDNLHLGGRPRNGHTGEVSAGSVAGVLGMTAMVGTVGAPCLAGAPRAPSR